MPIPAAAAPAIPWLTKLLLGAKAAGTAAKGFAAKAAASGAGRAVAGAGSRMAGASLKMTPKEIAYSLAPDVVFGGMTAISTPGDAGDKLIAGLGSGIGGGAAGLATRKFLPIKNQALASTVDVIAGVGGDGLGSSAADALLRFKAEDNLTPFEREALRQELELRGEIERQSFIDALNA